MSFLEEESRKSLRFIQRTNKDKKIYIKVTALLMLDKGYSAVDIAETLGIDVSTLYRYKESYESLGLDKYLSNNYLAYQGKLNAVQLAKLKDELRENFYQSSAQVGQYIETSFGIRLHTTSIVRMLHRLGFVYKKTRHSISQGDKVQQAAFLEKLSALLADRDHEVYFTDGVHPQHNTRPETGWIEKGQNMEIAANTGRRRMNINGALNARAVEKVEIVEAETINAQAMIELLTKLEKCHPGKHIDIICDNAPYNRSKVLTDWLKSHTRISIHYLPSYSPNLNLIERLWKFMKKKVINSWHYAAFDDFRQAIWGFFNNIHQFKQELTSLLTLKFHLH